MSPWPPNPGALQVPGAPTSALHSLQRKTSGQKEFCFVCGHWCMLSLDTSSWSGSYQFGKLKTGDPRVQPSPTRMPRPAGSEQEQARSCPVSKAKLFEHLDYPQNQPADLKARLENQCAAAAKSLQSCPTLCDPRDGSPPGSPAPGILQARTLEWVAISFSNA